MTFGKCVKCSGEDVLNADGLCPICEAEKKRHEMEMLSLPSVFRYKTGEVPALRVPIFYEDWAVQRRR